MLLLTLRLAPRWKATLIRFYLFNDSNHNILFFIVICNMHAKTRFFICIFLHHVLYVYHFKGPLYGANLSIGLSLMF